MRSLAGINQLVARSKAHWSWPAGYLAKALALQKITPERIGHGIGRWACARIFQWVRVPSRIPGGPLFSIYRIQLLPQPDSGGG